MSDCLVGLQNEKQALTMELKGVIEQHRQEMESSSQLQDLAAMLQESHRYNLYVICPDGLSAKPDMQSFVVHNHSKTLS